MGFFDWLFGRKEPADRWPMNEPYHPGRQAQAASDEQALQRYRYMLRTAPPELIEQAHEEAFARLTPEQRRMVLRELAATLPEKERALGMPAQADPKTLARMATRAEIRQPGTIERTFGGVSGMSMGGLMAGSFLSSLAGAVVGSMIAQQFFDGYYDPGFTEGDVNEQDWVEPVDDTSSDLGGGEDFSDFGGDFGADF